VWKHQAKGIKPLFSVACFWAFFSGRRKCNNVSGPHSHLHLSLLTLSPYLLHTHTQIQPPQRESKGPLVFLCLFFSTELLSHIFDVSSPAVLSSCVGELSKIWENSRKRAFLQSSGITWFFWVSADGPQFAFRTIEWVASLRGNSRGTGK